MIKDKSTNSEKSIKATKIAALKATDKADLASCVSDMKKFANLDDNSANEVAQAIRAKNLPSILMELGLGGNDFDTDNGAVTNDFANKEENNDDSESNDMDELNDTNIDDSGEVNDEEGLATIQISVPKSKIKLVEEALENALGGENMDVDPMSDSEDSEDSESSEDPEQSEYYDDDSDSMIQTNKGDDTMDKNTLAQRKAERRNIIAQVEEIKPRDIGLGNDTSSLGKPFEFSAKNQKAKEQKLKTKNFSGGEETDFTKDFPKYNTSKVPTLNSEYLGDYQSIDAMKFSNTPEHAVDFEVKFNMFDTGSTPLPSNDEAGLEMAPIYSKHDVEFSGNPVGGTQRVSSILGDLNVDKAEDLLAGLLIEAGIDENDLGKMTFAEGVDLLHEMRTAKKEKEAEVTIEVEAKKEDKKKASSLEKEAELDRARIKTAYACTYKLVEAGVVQNDEADAYAEAMLSDGFSVPAMLRQTTFTLRAAQAYRKEKTASSNGQTRVASSGISFNPALNSSPDLTGALDIRQALAGMFTTSKYGDVEDDKLS